MLPYAAVASPEHHFCRWGFSCTKSFFSPTELLQHVIRDHVRTAVSVNRHEIPILLRATEGIGESYETVHFLSSQEFKNTSQDSNSSFPAASLPSPPISSSSRRPHGPDGDRGSLFSDSNSSQTSARTPSPNLYLSEEEDIDVQNGRPNVLLSDAIESPRPRFASLDTSGGSPRPGSIPPSPTFSDILASSTQKNRLLAPRDSTSSTDSCAIVAEQLTPIDEANVSDDQIIRGPAATVGSDDSGIYAGELNWNARTSQNSSSQTPTTAQQDAPESSQSARDYGSIVTRRPATHHSMQKMISSLPPSPELSRRRQSWYAPRTRKRSRGDGAFSPIDSPAISPIASFSGPIGHSVSPGNRLKVDSADSDSAEHQRTRIRRRVLSPAPKERESQQDDSWDADVSEMQVETQLTMSRSASPIAQPKAYQRQSRYDMYDYPIQTQAPYDS